MYFFIIFATKIIIQNNSNEKKEFIYYSLSYCILTLSIQAQENYYGKIVDNKQQPISFANVALLNANDSSFVTGVTTDEDGKFNLLNVSKGLLKDFSNWI